MCARQVRALKGALGVVLLRACISIYLKVYSEDLFWVESVERLEL